MLRTTFLVSMLFIGATVYGQTRQQTQQPSQQDRGAGTTTTIQKKSDVEQPTKGTPATSPQREAQGKENTRPARGQNTQEQPAGTDAAQQTTKEEIRAKRGHTPSTVADDPSEVARKQSMENANSPEERRRLKEQQRQKAQTRTSSGEFDKDATITRQNETIAAGKEEAARLSANIHKAQEERKMLNAEITSKATSGSDEAEIVAKKKQIAELDQLIEEAQIELKQLNQGLQNIDASKK